MGKLLQTLASREPVRPSIKQEAKQKMLSVQARSQNGKEMGTRSGRVRRTGSPRQLEDGITGVGDDLRGKGIRFGVGLLSRA